MKPEDILEALGNVNDTCVKEAKEKEKSYKFVWLAIGSLAACVLAVLIFPSLLGSFNRHDGSVDAEIAIEHDNVWIYYVEAGQIRKTKEYVALQASTIFAKWKEKNGIGEEVELIKFKIESNGTTSEQEFGGDTVVEYVIGDYHVLNITISENLKTYYEIIDSELLIESLRQTMTGYMRVDCQECNINLE